MQLILARTLLTRRLSMQKACPKAIQSIAKLPAIIKRRSVLHSAPHQLAKLQLTPCIHTAHKDANSAGNYMLASLRSSSRSNIMPRPSRSAVSELQHIVDPARAASTTYRRPKTCLKCVYEESLPLQRRFWI